MLKMLLTSGGVKPGKIHAALLELLGKPIAECAALAISTSSYGLPGGMGLAMAWEFLNGHSPDPEAPMTELGWKSLGVLELSALPSMGEERWVPVVRAADVILVNGGDPLFLHYWMRESGLAALLPELDVVWVGMSAGSMIMTPRIGKWFVGWTPPGASKDDEDVDLTLGLVDFAMFPHLGHPMLPSNTMENAAKWAASLPDGMTAYAVDDHTAFTVVDGAVAVISDGQWHRLQG